MDKGQARTVVTVSMLIVFSMVFLAKQWWHLISDWIGRKVAGENLA